MTAAVLAKQSTGKTLRVASVCRLFPSPTDPSCGVFVDNRVSAMAKRMWVRKLQPLPYFPGLKPLDGELCQTDDHITRLPMFYLPGVLKSLDSRWLSRAIGPEVAKLVKTQGLDVIDAHFAYPDGVGCARVARKHHIPLIVTMRGVENEQLDEPGIGDQIRHLFQQVDGCICVSGFLAELALRNGMPESRLEIIHNAVDETTFYPGFDAMRRETLGLSTDRQVIVCVGQLIPRKRQHILIHALHLLQKARNDARLIFIGAPTDNRYTLELHELVAAFDLEESVSFTGVMPPTQVADYLRAADAFAMVSSREGCCNAVLEALACGAPVVTTPVGDNALFVRDAENGYLVPVDDAETTARSLAVLLDRGRWNAEQISSALEVGTWEDVAGRVEKFFRRVLS